MTSYRRGLTALAACLIIPAAAAAQSLQPGTWTGVVSPPDGEVAVTYDVKVNGDTIAITVNAGPHGSYKFEEVKLAGDKLTFWFQPGPRVSCELNRKEDGSFVGTCSDGSLAVPMTMLPPKKPATP